MADVKISALPAASSVASTDELEVNQGGTSRKATAAQVAAGGAVSGSYTPTLTNIANLDSTTAYSSIYLRVGSVVHVAGVLDYDPTAATTDTRIGVSLPVASNFGSSLDAHGLGYANGKDTSVVYADTTNDRAEINFTSLGTTGGSMRFNFSYKVI